MEDDDAAAAIDVVDVCLDRADLSGAPALVAVAGAFVDAEGGLMVRDDCASFDGGLDGPAFFSASTLILRFWVVSSSTYSERKSG